MSTPAAAPSFMSPFSRFGSQKLPQREKRSSKREPWRWMENNYGKWCFLCFQRQQQTVPFYNSCYDYFKEWQWALRKKNIQNWFKTLKPSSALKRRDIQNKVGGDFHKCRGEASDTMLNKGKFRAVSTSVLRGDLIIRQSESDNQSH